MTYVPANNSTLSAALNGSAPANTFGLNGEYVLDPSNGYLWGPKTSNVWPATPNQIFSSGGGGSPTSIDGGSASSSASTTIDGGSS